MGEREGEETEKTSPIYRDKRDSGDNSKTKMGNDF
jgi:hypothetical protein